MSSGITLLVRELHRAETQLADAFRAVAERQAADHGTHYPCRTLADQCDQHARQIRDWAAGRFGVTLHEPQRPAPLTAAVGTLRRTSSELTGRRRVSGLLLLRDLRGLYVKAEHTSIHWVMLGQAAQALRDHDLLGHVSDCHEQTRTQAKWITTRIKEAAPQALL
ncbi:hypothetical protein C3486_24490 [Streptomyces sp. Ru73]|uniref:hypothetical protein n=1 Tax=Streptomyces sp. Ru73 TaxID=2080748 RepID=UPI000CDD50FD|nr:hypothetical protein [Streptomyces sp. Ru73]POX38180.1 hypothetical protein C3486_24490 [Streptomyces sp. Ru73]